MISDSRTFSSRLRQSVITCAVASASCDRRFLSRGRNCPGPAGPAERVRRVLRAMASRGFLRHRCGHLRDDATRELEGILDLLPIRLEDLARIAETPGVLGEGSALT